MEDLLYEAAIEYQKLRDVTYDIKIGRKGKAYDILLRFPYESFFHLAGLQHLDDLTFPSTNKERIYKMILEQKITIDFLKKSPNYEKYYIEERLGNLYLIESILENNQITYLINPKEYAKYTSIRAHYLIEHKELVPDIFYLFIKKVLDSEIQNDHRGCSFFKKHDTDFTKGTAKAVLLLMNKIIRVSKEETVVEEIYRNPSYKE